MTLSVIGIRYWARTVWEMTEGFRRTRNLTSWPDRWFSGSLRLTPGSTVGGHASRGDGTRENGGFADRVGPRSPIEIGDPATRLFQSGEMHGTRASAVSSKASVTAARDRVPRNRQTKQLRAEPMRPGPMHTVNLIKLFRKKTR